VYTGFSNNHKLRDGDSDFSDDEVKANSTRLGGNLFGTRSAEEVVVNGHCQGISWGPVWARGCRNEKLVVEEREAMS